MGRGKLAVHDAGYFFGYADASQKCLMFFLLAFVFLLRAFPAFHQLFSALLIRIFLASISEPVDVMSTGEMRSEAIQIITEYTQPGDFVVDTFGGGFTTAAACHRLGRRCLTCDIDAEAVQKGFERLAWEREQREKNK